MDPIHLLKSMLAGIAAGLGAMYAPQLDLSPRPAAGRHPPGAGATPPGEVYLRPVLRLPEQLRGRCCACRNSSEAGAALAGTAQRPVLRLPEQLRGSVAR
jgi:hypothetical protein